MPTSLELIVQKADLVCGQARRSRLAVGYNYAGLDWADKFIVSQQHEPDAFKESLVTPLACFFGECVRCLCSGIWDTESEPWSVRVQRQVVVYPFARIERLLFDYEDEASLSDFVATVIALSKRNEDI